MSERMQALLSRAVEDQLTEQRQLASLVAEVRALLSALPGEVAAAAPADEQVRSEVSRLRAGLAAVEQRLAVLTAAAERPTDLSSVTGVVGAVGQQVGQLSARLDSLESSLAAVSAAVATAAASAAASEQRIVAHVDEAVLALAEVLVRRGKPTPTGTAPRTPAASEPAPQMAPVEIAAAPVVPLAQDPTPPDAAVDIAVVEDVPGLDEEDEYDDAVVEDAEAEDAELEDDEDEDDELEADAELEEDEVEEDELEDEDDEDDDDDEAEEGEEAEEAASSQSSDPWAVPSPFQPGPPRERQDTGAAAAIAELHAGETPAAEEPAPEEPGKRRPWWKPGD
jgi:hypothetical protein